MHPQLAALVTRPIAHRGLHGCGGPGPVENSLGAARAAIAAGYGIECDVLLSRDGEAIVFHDEDLQRLTGTSGRLADRDVAALTQLRLAGGGERIPTLSDFLAVVAGRVPLVIEIKSGGDMRLVEPRLVERTLAVIADYRGAVAIESFDAAAIRHAAQLGTSRPIGLVGPLQAGAEPPPDVVRACDFLSWSIDELVSAAARSALPLTTWTVRSHEQAARAREHDAQIVFEGFAP